VSEVDVNGHLLTYYVHVWGPLHLSVDDDDNVLVANFHIHCVLLFNTQLQRHRCVLSDNNNSQFKLWSPTRLCYSPVSSMLLVAHRSRCERKPSDRISLFRLR